MGLLSGFLFTVVDIFFRECDGFNAHKIPTNEPVLFVCGPHANQFLDPLVVTKNSGRPIGFLTAAVSMKRRFVGGMARAMNSIPVSRPQDFAFKGTGKVTAEGLQLKGEGTKFSTELTPGATLVLNKQSYAVDKVISDTEALLKDALAAPCTTPTEYKIIPKLDQSAVYEQVFAELNQNKCVGIFPEGGSHDRTDLLPLKAGFTIMALGFLAKHPEKTLKIVPAGLNYFRAHRFRSQAYVDFGDPIEIPPELVEGYKKGGAEKRAACEKLLNIVEGGLRAVTLNAPDYETLQLYRAAGRLYKPKGMKLTPDQRLQIQRRFAWAYERTKDRPEVMEFKDKLRGYHQQLHDLGLKDHQVKTMDRSCFSSLWLLIWRFLTFLVMLLFALPGLVINLPAGLYSDYKARQKAAEALKASTVKVAARDVMATWKLLVAVVLVPLTYLLYTLLAVLLMVFADDLGWSILPLWARIVIPIGTAILVPILSYISILFAENGNAVLRSLRALSLSLFSRRLTRELRDLRKALQADVVTLVENLGPELFRDFHQIRTIPLSEHTEKFQLVSNPLFEQIEEAPLRLSTSEAVHLDPESDLSHDVAISIHVATAESDSAAESPAAVAERAESSDQLVPPKEEETA